MLGRWNASGFPASQPASIKTKCRNESDDQIDETNQIDQIDRIDEIDQTDEKDLPPLLTRGGTQIFDCPTVKNSPMLVFSPCDPLINGAR